MKPVNLTSSLSLLATHLPLPSSSILISHQDRNVLGSHWPTCHQPVSFDPFNPQGQRSFLNGLLPGPLSGFSRVLRGKCSLTPGPRELLFHPASPYFPTLPWIRASGLQPARASSIFWKLCLLSSPTLSPLEAPLPFTLVPPQAQSTPQNQPSLPLDVPSWHPA